ncbi:MAG: TlpA disulfide reductase family protein [Blastocatellia bacterium]
MPAPGFEAFDQNKNLITNRDFSGRVVVLDFWFTGCGACFRKFPQLQKIYEQYRNHPAVTVLAVNKPVDGDKEWQAFQMIREDGYSFPVVIAKDEKMIDSLGIEHYPTTVLINKHGKVVFKGGIEKVEKYLDELIAEK